MPARFDKQLLQDLADDLYSQAAWIQWWTVFQWAAVVGLGCAAFMLVKRSGGIVEMLPVLVAVILGYGHGARKALQLRLEAQRLLLQMQVEENTAGTKEILERWAAASSAYKGQRG